MIALPPLGGEGDALWTALLDIASRAPSGWTLIGGQMVLLHALERGREMARVSTDLDLVVNLRLRPPALPAFVALLGAEGFEPRSPVISEAAHRFIRGSVIVDVLAPDHMGTRADLRTVGSARTLEVGGGTFALRRSMPVAVTFAGREADVPRPDLAGAIVLKALAATADRRPGRHLGDLALLLTLASDPDRLCADLGARYRRRVAAVTALSDPDHEAWRLIADPVARFDGQEALAFITDVT